MADAQSDWSTDSNKAVNISLVAPSDAGTRTLYTFNPKMTYSIFGEEESLFGYQGLKINLRYNACDMRPGLQIQYTRKFKTVGETAPTDLKPLLEEYLPKTAFDKSTVFDTAIAAEIPKPPGELWQTFDVDGQTYEVWKGTLDEIPIQQVVRRIQILVPFFIEGGTCIDMRESDETLERWTVFFLYQKKTINVDPRASPYVFMGYSTVYRYFYYQPLSSQRGKKQRISHQANLDFPLPLLEKLSFTEYPCRSRISQFVILPPFQGGGNGSRFYNSIFDFYLKDPSTLEITVEDPNEAFDDLRDVNDLARLRTRLDFSGLHINSKAAIRAKGSVPKDILDPEQLEKIRKSIKIAPRQFARVVEMHLLSLIPSGVRASLIVERPSATVPDLKLRQHEYHLWQLLVKNRLYRHNKDQLIQLDRTDRIEKLDQALGSVEADYGRLLRALDRRLNGETSENGKDASNGKRSSPDDEGEDDGEPAAKKVKFT